MVVERDGDDPAPLGQPAAERESVGLAEGRMSVVTKYVPAGRYTSNPASAGPALSRSRSARRSARSPSK
jgi:hypothetical protein